MRKDPPFPLYKKDKPMDDSTIELLMGKTLTKIIQSSDEVYFHCKDGDVFRAYHMQDCCESVSVYDVVGDLYSLIGSPIKVAKEDSIEPVDIPSDHKYSDYSHTWTIHTLETETSKVVIRWLGESNGYYSESVYFQRTHEPWSE